METRIDQSSPHRTADPRLSGRRAFLHTALLLAGGTIAGCTPARVLLKLYPDRFESDARLVDELLRAFVLTIIPGADSPHLINIFRDERFPFYKHLGFFTSDLARRSSESFGTDQFHQLSYSQREQIVRGALESDATTARLYRAAILAAQGSFYGAIYSEKGDCALIEWRGTNTGFSRREMYYADGAERLPHTRTRDGNFN